MEEAEMIFNVEDGKVRPPQSKTKAEAAHA
jgi:hypothetical protein